MVNPFQPRFQLPTPGVSRSRLCALRHAAGSPPHPATRRDRGLAGKNIDKIRGKDIDTGYTMVISMGFLWDYNMVILLWSFY